MEYQHKSEPFRHQAEEFELSREMATRALFWEQGTGKTKPAIDTAAWLFETDKIDAVVVMAPSGVHRNWLTDEIPKHLPDRVAAQSRSLIWDTKRCRNVSNKGLQDLLIRHRGLAWLFISYDAANTELGKKYLWRFLRNRRCLYIADESHYIKTPGAKRTKALVASGRYAPYKRLLTGTPIATGPFDLFSQVKFLDEDFWKALRLDSFRVFKFHYGEWYTRDEVMRDQGYDPGYDKFIDYKNIDELKRVVETIGSRVTKDEVLDLPPKLYTRRYFSLNSEQAELYNLLRDEYTAETAGGNLVEAELAIVRLLRLHQVVSGYVGVDSEDPEPFELVGKTNPLLDEVEDACSGLYHQGIIWCRFTHTVDQLMERLGKSAVRYDGQLSEDECELSKAAFQAGDAQWFIGNAQKGATGLTLVQAKTVMYAENSFRYVDRVQSEDRAHRIGQDDPVSYIDFEGRLPDGRQTVSRHIINNLRGKRDIASQITGDEYREWL